MDTAKIASRLVELCRRGDYEAAQTELFADDAVSIEPDSTPETTVRGRAGLAEKSRMFAETFEVHGGAVSDPVVGGAFFACAMTADVTEKKSGARMKLEEICVYEVRDGKIVREQFFYPPERWTKNGVRSMNEVYPLERVAEAYDRMMSGKARFRVVLEMRN